MGLFIPSLSSLKAPLGDFATDNSLFSWKPAHQKIFDAIKNAISAQTKLAHYNPIKRVILQADA